jgi:hypothetical protein
MLAFLEMLLWLLSASTIMDDHRTGGGRGGGGGEYDKECLLDNDRNNAKYKEDNEPMLRRMGRGCAGEQTMGGIQ